MSAVRTDRRGAALLVRLDHPTKLNALSPAMVDGLAAAFDVAETEESIRAVVLTGSGRAFCAGADLSFVGPESHSAVTEFLDRLGAVLLRIERFPKPVLAAVNGIALGGGLELILCCDVVFAADSARMGDGHATYGFVPGGGASVRLPRRIGPSRAAYLLFSGLLQSAAELHAAGLVNEVVPDALLEQRVLEVVDLLAQRSPLGLARMKHLLRDGAGRPTEAAVRAELVMSDLHRRSHDNLEGVAAFAERRVPVFDGT